MKDCHKRVLACFAVLAAAAMSAYGKAVKDVKAVEIARLPTFCWEGYVEGASGPQYRIDRQTCGPATNHYCPGLIELMRAKASIGDARKRSYYLDRAKGQTLYTLRGIEQYPSCPIRGHAQDTLKEINGLLMGLGQK
jgi:hypothetical protein